jgi:hypothetical protein
LDTPRLVLAVHELINDERSSRRRAEQLTQADWPNGIAGVQDLLSAIDDLFQAAEGKSVDLNIRRG